MTWKEYIKIPRMRTELIGTFILLIAALAALANFLNFVESRNGVVLPDPVLELFSPVNLTWLTFGLVYFSVFLAVILLIKKPSALLFTMQTYALVIFIRIIVMFVVPFNPPAHMIRLDDPFVQFFGTGRILTKDLFFSGHTAIVFLFFLTAQNKISKTVFLLFTVIVGASVLLQHVHYTVDVIAAPFFTYGCYVAAKKIRKKLGLEFA